MKRYRYIFFDLDGTLTDPYEGITKSVQYALTKLGIEEPDRQKLRRFIGPPLRDSFPRYYGIPSDQIENAVVYYREYFSVTGIFENEVYPGVPELLARLNRRGIRVVLATSKPEAYAEKILVHFGLDRWFYAVCGSDFGGKREWKAEVIAYALEKCGASPDEVLMIGDRSHDMTGAADNGMDRAGVLYGYGSREELENAGAQNIVSSVEELTEWLCPSDEDPDK